MQGGEQIAEEGDWSIEGEFKGEAAAGLIKGWAQRQGQITIRKIAAERMDDPQYHHAHHLFFLALSQGNLVNSEERNERVRWVDLRAAEVEEWDDVQGPPARKAKNWPY